MEEHCNFSGRTLQLRQNNIKTSTEEHHNFDRKTLHLQWKNIATSVEEHYNFDRRALQLQNRRKFPLNFNIKRQYNEQQKSSKKV